MDGEVEHPVGDGRIEVGRALAQRRQQRRGRRAVGPALTVPGDDPPVGEQAHLPEHGRALHDPRPGDLLQVDELGLVLHGSVEAHEDGRFLVTVDDERRAAVGERAGHLPRQAVERDEVGDAAAPS